LKLGTLEHLDILCLTHINHNNESHKDVKPSIAVVRRLFEAYKHAFYNYTEHFIMYYLYRRDQIRTTFTMKELIEVVIGHEVTEYEQVLL